MSQIDKLAMEYAAAHSALLLATPEKQSSWAATSTGHRFMCYAGKTLVAFKVVNGAPVVTNRWMMVDVKSDTSRGFLSAWEDAEGKMTYVGHVPVELANRCFMWHNHSSGYEFTERYGSPSLRLSMTIRTQAHPNTKLEGVTYLTEESKLELLGVR